MRPFLIMAVFVAGFGFIASGQTFQEEAPKIIIKTLEGKYVYRATIIPTTTGNLYVHLPPNLPPQLDSQIKTFFSEHPFSAKNFPEPDEKGRPNFGFIGFKLDPNLTFSEENDSVNIVLTDRDDKDAPKHKFTYESNYFYTVVNRCCGSHEYHSSLNKTGTPTYDDYSIGVLIYKIPRDEYEKNAKLFQPSSFFKLSGGVKSSGHFYNPEKGWDRGGGGGGGAGGGSGGGTGSGAGDGLGGLLDKAGKQAGEAEGVLSGSGDGSGDEIIEKGKRALAGLRSAVEKETKSVTEEPTPDLTEARTRIEEVKRKIQAVRERVAEQRKKQEKEEEQVEVIVPDPAMRQHTILNKKTSGFCPSCRQWAEDSDLTSLSFKDLEEKRKKMVESGKKRSPHIWATIAELIREARLKESQKK